MDELDGFTIGYLPHDVGQMISGFAYEWKDVSFRSRTWERQVEGGYQVDLKINVLRGALLSDEAALLDFLARYHERDVDEWQLGEFEHGSYTRYSGQKEVFFLVEPGVAVEVICPSQRYGLAELHRIARGITPAD